MFAPGVKEFELDKSESKSLDRRGRSWESIGYSAIPLLGIDNLLRNHYIYPQLHVIT
jgi:hypothetical protein